MMIMDNLVKNPVFLGGSGCAEGWAFNLTRPKLSPGNSIVECEGTIRLNIISKGDRHAFGCWQGAASLKHR